MPNQLQPNTLVLLWDKLAFAQYVDVMLDLPPERCLDRVDGLEQPRRGVFNATSIVTSGGVNR